MLAEAVERIGSVIRSEVARLNKLDDDAAKSAKLEAIKSKAKSLMVSAQCQRQRFSKRTDEWSGADVDVIASELASDALTKFFG